ncbi:hypothetical protein ACF073_36005 [Streptomyces sp. NPDC015171]|uniref:hypothetical protein n=1 Tax=Streptomyces sp. NPDC015171 TaxID=3364945 RepID=UPI0037030520
MTESTPDPPMPPPPRVTSPPVSRLLVSGLFLALAVSGCGARTAPHRLAPDEVIKAATQRLTDSCLTRQGLTPPRPGQRTSDAEQQRVSAALFGTGPAELSLALPTGYVVRAHTDGCLAAAQQRLYGDQRRWFQVSVIVDNLRPEADHAHRSLAQVRARHRAEITDWQRLRAHALTQAAAVLDPNT